MKTQLVLDSKAPLSLTNIDVGTFLSTYAKHRLKDVVISFYYGKTIKGAYPDSNSLMKWWLESNTAIQWVMH